MTVPFCRYIISNAGSFNIDLIGKTGLSYEYPEFSQNVLQNINVTNVPMERGQCDEVYS